MPENFTYGYVTGTLVLSRGDGSDADRLPDAIGASGITVAFTRDQQQYATANPPRLISHAPVVAKTMADGQITSDLDEDGGVKPDATPGVWLVTGTYKVSTSSHYPDFSIVVTENHDETTPLDLALAVSYAPPAGVTVQTVALPAGAATGQVLTWGETGLSWAVPDAVAAPVTSVNGQIGDVVLAIPDVSDVIREGDTRLTDARTPTSHDHDDRYYTETETDTLLAGRAAANHTHPEYVEPADLAGYVATTDPRLSDPREPLAHVHPEYVETTDPRLADARTPTAHNHDDRYYTESEVDTALNGKADATQTINARIGSLYNLTASDAGKVVTIDNATPATVNVPASTFTEGQRIDIIQRGPASITFAPGSGMTLHGTPSLVTRAQWSAVSVLFLSATEGVVIGDLATP